MNYSYKVNNNIKNKQSGKKTHSERFWNFNPCFSLLFPSDGLLTGPVWILVLVLLLINPYIIYEHCIRELCSFIRVFRPVSADSQIQNDVKRLMEFSCTVY